MIDKNTPAFPVPEYEGHNGERAFRSPVQEGMTYRQWLIGMALSKLAVHLPAKGQCIDGDTRYGLTQSITGECIDYGQEPRCGAQRQPEAGARQEAPAVLLLRPAVQHHRDSRRAADEP